jgi:hypothetical protein
MASTKTGAAGADGAEKTGQFCSTFFPASVKAGKKHPGRKPSQAVRWFARRIDEFRGMGVHCSSSVMATLLLLLARR